MTSPAAPDRERLAVLVHEVRSPVAALAAIAEAYREAERSARRALVPLALAACAGIERLVTDLEVDSIVREHVDVGRVAEESAAAAELRGARIRTDVESGLPRVSADPQRVRQAIDNLITNALIHAPDGDVLVAVRSAGSTLVVSVADSGPGIPVEEQGRIFEAGVRLDRARPGSGLGLAIVRAIAEAHGGTLGVESIPGRGATFTLSLPLA
jgi:signal transduction histidine kinase